MACTSVPDNSYRLLAIDDDPAALLILKGAALGEGFEFLGFENWTEGMAALRDSDPDVVCLDVELPGATGFDLCRQIKADPDTRLRPVLIVTALNDSQSRVLGIEAGCDDFLSKPFDRLQLAARTRVLARSHRANRDLESTEQVLQALAGSIEARDFETGNHCERVGNLATTLGEWSRLSNHYLRALKSAGYLHDVGKIGVPDAVLLKPGPLNDDEWQIMRTHPVIGESIVRPLHSFRHVLPIIRHHHEHWDGSGYPDGLRADAIPIAARVFQVADVFDALTSHRPYRKPLELADAIATLEDEAAGGKWDPEIVTAFATGFDRDRAVIIGMLDHF